MDITIVSFPFLPNWRNTINFKYNFSTSVAENKRFMEQRRPIKDDMLREQVALFSKTEVEKDFLLNTLLYAKNKRLAIPIYAEYITTSTSPLLGVLSVVTIQDISKFWNIYNLGTYVLLIEKEDYTTFELIEIDYTEANAIYLKTAITKAFTDVIIFPIFFGNIDKININYLTSKVYEISLAFKEMKTYQHTETESDAIEDYTKRYISKGHSAVETITTPPTIVTNGNITITPGENPPPGIVTITVVSIGTGDVELRTEDKELNVDGNLVITKVGDEIGIKIIYKWTNIESDIVYFLDDFWVTDVVNWWNIKDKSVLGMNKEIKLIDDGESLGKIIDYKEVEIYEGTTYNTLVTKTLQSSLSAYTNRDEPLFWTYDAYLDSGALPEDYCTNFMALSPALPSGYQNPDDKIYPPPGQNYTDTDLFVMKVKEVYTDTTSRITQPDTTEQGAYYYLGRTFAYTPTPNLVAEAVDADYFRIYAYGSSSYVHRGFIPTASYRGYVYPSGGGNYIGEASGTFALKTGHWGSVVFPRLETSWGISSGYPYYVVIQMIYGGVEVWFSPEACGGYFT